MRLLAGGDGGRLERDLGGVKVLLNAAEGDEALDGVDEDFGDRVEGEPVQGELKFSKRVT